MKYQLEITSNGGYSADQVKGMTVGELISLLEQLDQEDEVILHDEGNRYGASYGYFNGNWNECQVEEDVELDNE